VEHKNDCGSYDGEMEDISVDDPRSDFSTSKAEITDSHSESCVDIQAVQWVEMRNSGLPHSTESLSIAQDCLG
jgi:hypothetical protein